MRYTRIETLMSACALMLSLVMLNAGCSGTGSGMKQTTENPGLAFGAVKSAAGAKMLTPIALRGERKASGHLFFELAEPAGQEVAVTFKVDQKILDAYNRLNGTGYVMYPADKLSLENNGNALVEAGKSKSETVALNILPGGTEGATYAVAVSASATVGTEKHTDNQAFIYLVKPLAAMQEVNAGRKIKNLCYVEVNRESMLNAGEYVMKGSKTPFFDIVSVFAANIRLGADDIPYVSCNEQTRFVLDNIERTVRPLQAKGIKVHLSILGDHTAAGMRSLSKDAARAFAEDLKAYMDIYGFDGIDFDDEYSTYATDQTLEPYVASDAVASSIDECTPQRYADLVYESRKLMPDKTIGIYWYAGHDYPVGTVEGKTVDELVDYSIYGLYGKWRAIPADTLSIAKQCPYAVEVTTAKGDVKIEDNYLKDIRQNGWGYFAVYDLNDDRSYEKEFSRISRLLYDEEVEWSGKQYGRTEW